MVVVGILVTLFSMLMFPYVLFSLRDKSYARNTAIVTCICLFVIGIVFIQYPLI